MDPQFQKISGKNAWFPWGIFARGYVISSEKEQEARNFLVTYYSIAFGIIFVLVVFQKQYLLSAVLFLISLIYYWYKVKIITKGAPKVNNTKTLLEIYQMQAKSMGRKTVLAYFVLILAVSLFFGYGVIFLNFREWWMIATFLMTVLLTLYGWYLVKHST